MMNLKDIGFDKWFEDKIDKSKLSRYNLARIIAVNKDSYTISNGKNDISAQISGKMIYNAESPLDYPGVGDWVYAQYLDEGSFAVIDEIIPRKTVLSRKTAGKKIDYQLIAANINSALIMQSLDLNYNLRRLERYLAMITEACILPIVLLSKSDLISSAELKNKIIGINKILPDLQIYAFSNLTNSGVDDIQRLLKPKETYCLVGSSGVGKTTLLNKLIGEEKFEVQEIRRKDGRGRHTTSRRQLIRLPNGALIIDTPGMRELGNISIEDGIEETFPEISNLAQKCFFNNCSHTSEKGCAVLDALNNGKIDYKRYQNFLKIKKESLFYEMSYIEKRKKDKQFGKLIKSLKKMMLKNNFKR